MIWEMLYTSTERLGHKLYWSVYVYIHVCYTCGVSGLCIEVCICMTTEAYIPFHPPSPPPPDPYSHEWSDYFQVHFVDIRRKEWDDLLFYVVRKKKVRTYVRTSVYVRMYKVATSNTYFKCYSMFSRGAILMRQLSLCHAWEQGLNAWGMLPHHMHTPHSNQFEGPL